MVPLIVLIVTFIIFFAVKRNWVDAARYAFAAMFVLTASAHFVPSQRIDLVRMVPPMFPRPDLIVMITGVLELLGAIGLLVPRTSRLAAGALAVMLVALFPANIHAAMNELMIMGKPATALLPRTLMQIVFIGGLTMIAWRPRWARPAPVAA
ncbi:MAG TPA: hypothetical protein VEK79_03860 [Thermoanaerobaculia bacterium]|nr:hypothetical protein [Thermoanaerobaculia bacterium]